MLKFILGLLVGYCVSDNKDIVKKYFNMFIDWCKKMYKRFNSNNKTNN